MRVMSGASSNPVPTRDEPDEPGPTPDRRPALGAGRVELSAQALDYARRSKSEATIRAYRADWGDFDRWCAERRAVSLPASPDTLCEYLAEGAERLRPSTLQRRLAAIALAHDSAGVHSPTRHAAVRAVMSGIRRTHGSSVEQKQALRTSEVEVLAGACGDDTAGRRDRALLLLGFAAGLRRSELVTLDVEDLEFVPEGIVVTIRRSKTDQEGHGRLVAVPRGSTALDPVAAVEAWIDQAELDDGPLLRPVDRHGRVKADRLTGQSVALILKRLARRAGLDESRLAGHSLRAGFATSAARAGASERSIMDTTGHRSVETVRRYIRAGELFDDPAASRLGL